MNLLLTGSSGWLGRFLAPRLQAKGYQTIGLDVVDGDYTDVVGSVANKALVESVVSDRDIGAVIHAGALHKPDIARYPAPAFVDVNVTGTLNLLEAARNAGHDRFIFTSTTSLMISSAVRAGKSGGATSAFWLDEEFGPLKPRNIYGVTKLAAEHLCRLWSDQHGMDIAILRTGRFFPEDDDTFDYPAGPNLKANEFLNRRLTVEDAADAHISALENISGLGCETFILSAPPPFVREDCSELISDLPATVLKYHPDADELYRQKGWVMPDHVDRVYDPAKAERVLGFRPQTDFSTILDALKARREMPFQHDPDYISPKETA